MIRFAQAALFAALLFPSAARAEDGYERYMRCMTQVDIDAEKAFDDAVQWEGLGGGHPARHCALAALVRIGHYNEAAQGLEKLADAVKAKPGFKARLLAQSAQAWIAAGDAEHAAQVAGAALKLQPDLDAARLARAEGLALQGAYADAADDLNAVLKIQPDHVEALVMLGAAHRQLDRLERALAVLDRALALAPRHPEGLLERGIVHRLQGRKAEARADWRAALDAAPDSDAARSAQANIHLLDSGVQ
ncbi:MAG: tetratricopeptide repeat protein [Alphaproteobacteria bacterium]|nr:tetratricopeptide repeat protein [Alphaproteobacteria bacterium]